MKIKILLFLVLTLSAGLSCIFAQTKTITGTITNDDNNPVSEVTVACKWMNISTQSDNKGKYSITVPDSVSTLSFTKLGFHTTSIKISSNKIDVVLGIAESFELSLEDIIMLKVSTVTLKEQEITDVPGIVSVITS